MDRIDLVQRIVITTGIKPTTAAEIVDMLCADIKGSIALEDCVIIPGVGRLVLSPDDAAVDSGLWPESSDGRSGEGPCPSSAGEGRRGASSQAQGCGRVEPFVPLSGGRFQTQGEAGDNARVVITLDPAKSLVIVGENELTVQTRCVIEAEDGPDIGDRWPAAQV